MASAIVLSLAGLGGLYAYATCSVYCTPQEERLVRIPDLKPGDVGSIISLQGYFVELKEYKTGSKLVLIDLENGENLEASMSKKIADSFQRPSWLESGAEVLIRGMVDSFEGQFELTVTSTEAIQLIQPPCSLSVDVSLLLTHPEWYNEFCLLVEGTIVQQEAVSDGEYVVFLLRSTHQGSDYYLHCFYFEEFPVRSEDGTIVENRTSVLATGTFEYIPTSGFWRLGIGGPSDIKRQG